MKGQKTKTLEGKVVWWDEDDEGVRTVGGLVFILFIYIWGGGFPGKQR